MTIFHRTKMLNLRLLTLCCIASCLAVADARSIRASDKVSTVEYVDIDRYLGTWHEIARFDNRFQKGCVDSKAEYSLRKNGDIQVVNSCRMLSTGKRKVARGRAWIKDKETNSKLKVQFFLSGLKLGLFAGNYWVLALDEDYGYVMVGEPDRDYLWILARQKAMPQNQVEDLVKAAEKMGFDTDRLVFNQVLSE